MRTYWLLLGASLVGCELAGPETDGDEFDDESVGEAAQAICSQFADPATTPVDALRGAWGPTNAVRSDGFPGPCGFYTFRVTGAEPADDMRYVRVEYETPGACSDADPLAQRAYAHRLLSSGAITPHFVRHDILMAGVSSGAFCKWSGTTTMPIAFPEVRISAHGENPNGTTVAPRITMHGPSFSAGTASITQPPTICPVGGSGPPAPLDSTAALINGTTAVTYGASPAVAGCDYLSLSVDTTLRRPHKVDVWVVNPRIETVDVDSIEIFM